MIERAGIDFKKLDDEPFDQPFGVGTGAGEIFGATGGVMEAALRTAAESILGKPLEKLDFYDVRGTAGIKRATYKLGDLEVKVAVVSGTANAKKLLDRIKSGEEDVTFVEIMACPGGCVNGGGQPLQPAVVRNNVNLREKARGSALRGRRAQQAAPLAREPSLQNALRRVFRQAGQPQGARDSAHALCQTRAVKYSVSE